MIFKGKYIDQCIESRKNNFDIIRFFAATLVVFSHAYPLTSGHNGSEPFGLLTNGQMTYGELAVSVFFMISGFLITQSYDRSKNIIYYFKARILRIFPALIYCVLLSVFLLGPIFTEMSMKDYFKDYNTYEYLQTISLYWIQFDLPGVFLANVWPNAVNGSIWTLWYEFFFYIVVAALGVTRLLNKWVVLAGFIFSGYLNYHSIGGFYTELFIYFAAGMIFYLFRNQIKLNGVVAIISFLILIFTRENPIFGYLLSILGTYIIFYMAFNSRVRFHSFGKFGDFSYGIYIYGFPVQQIITHLFAGQLTHIENFLLAFPITLILAIVSWNLIEKRALKYKNYSVGDLFKKKELPAEYKLFK